MDNIELMPLNTNQKVCSKTRKEELKNKLGNYTKKT
jgi:hypothetical protein